MKLSSLALNFHENTKTIVGSEHFDSRIAYKIYPNTKTIPMPKNEPHKWSQQDNSFLHALLSRKSVRAFQPKSINLKELSALLTLSCGLRNDHPDSIFRTYASAGARYPIEVYTIIFQSDDLERGIYHYNICDNTLELIKAGDYRDQVNDFYRNQDTIIEMNFPCLILFSTISERTMEKYGERGYRFILLDAGHMSQNLYLTATYLNLGMVALGAGAASDDQLNDLLGLAYQQESVFYGFAVGYPR